MIKKPEEPTQKPGRSTIDNPVRRGSFSKRAADGKIETKKVRCHRCGHHKSFSKPKGIYCCRCGNKIRS